mgnify:CR=1 FL=1
MTLRNVLDCDKVPSVFDRFARIVIPMNVF